MNVGKITFRIDGAPALAKSFFKEYALFAKRNPHLALLKKKVPRDETLVAPFDSRAKGSFINFFTNFLENQYRKAGSQEDSLAARAG